MDDITLAMAKTRSALHELNLGTAPAVVVPFPTRPGTANVPEIRVAANDPSPRSEAPAPAASERPTLLTPAVREWLRAGLIVSVAIHVIVFLAFQLRFHDDLERASGASAALSSQGTIMIPVEVVVEARLPSAPAPTNATPDAREAKPTEDVSIDKLMPKPVQPAPVVIQQTDVAKLFPKTEPAPVAKEPEAPTAMVVPEQTPAPKREQAKPIEREKKTARATPSAAASPSHAASANSSGSAGAGGQVTTGGSAAISSYQAQVLSHLQQHRVYPPEARARGITGVARVQFALARDGRVLSVSLIGNGERVLDNAAIDMVRRASPFPPFPPGLSQPRIDFVAPVRFDLQ